MVVIVSKNRLGLPWAEGIAGSFSMYPCKLRDTPTPLRSRSDRQTDLVFKNNFTSLENWHKYRSEATLDYVWVSDASGVQVLHAKNFKGTYEVSGIPTRERQDEAWTSALNAKLNEQETEYKVHVEEAKVCTALVVGDKVVHLQSTFEELVDQIRYWQKQA